MCGQLKPTECGSLHFSVKDDFRVCFKDRVLVVAMKVKRRKGIRTGLGQLRQEGPLIGIIVELEERGKAGPEEDWGQLS